MKSFSLLSFSLNKDSKLKKIYYIFVMADKDKHQLTISEILNNALSTDKLIREDSHNKLQELAVKNFTEFLYNLGSELSDESKPVKIRQIAAVYLKNSIVNSNELRDIWVNKLDPNAKNQIKSLVLATLATNFKEVRKAAGIVIAGICKVDLPLNEKWPELINSLCQSSFNENLNIKLAALESLGYVCEELNIKTIDVNSVDAILSAIIQNFSTSLEIAKVSLKAFFHAIKLAEKNFSIKTELNIIMECIFTAGNLYANDDEVLEKIAQIFIEIASLSNYYDYIFDYIQKISEFTFYIVKLFFN
jgi:importin subunit beta-1